MVSRFSVFLKNNNYYCELGHNYHLFSANKDDLTSIQQFRWKEFEGVVSLMYNGYNNLCSIQGVQEKRGIRKLGPKSKYMLFFVLFEQF